ncbi:restriction endonuclease subunit S [Halomonas sp. 25-S5]|uniref:restriction endonuclease subunit S n=1 Tax=Halomonas sp. 25-S5 TaxID=2994065 RepID=UPI00246826D5|nr:restriction endonuclease subunit S [Halomonas sp. 25-S5]
MNLREARLANLEETGSAAVSGMLIDHLDLWTGAVTSKSTAGRGTSSGKRGKIELTGIKKLRELILELAVRGKLVDQDPSDEPASVLLERIAEEKARLVKEGKIKKPKRLPPITDNEEPYDLPSGWQITRIGEFINLTSGQHLKGEEYSETPDQDSIPYLTGPAEFGSINPMPTRHTKERRALARPRDILITCKGSGVGKLNWADEDIAISRQLMAISPIIINGRYAFIILDSLRESIRENIVGIAIPGISREDISHAIAWLPPLSEQDRIVEKVDELMALCDRLEQQIGDQLEAHEVLVDTLLGALIRSADAAEVAQSWARIAEHFDTLFTTEASIDKLKQTILQLAVMGRLVPQDPDDEPASVLLERIAEEKARLVKEGRIKKPKSVAPVRDEERSYLTHANWAWARFQDIANEISTGPFGSMIHKHDYVDDGVPLINPSHMVSGEIQEDRSVSIPGPKAEELSSYKLAAGDMVMARRGEVGRCAIVTDREAGWLCGTGSFVLRFHDSLSRRFILMMFATDRVRGYLTGNSIGTTMTNLNHGILNRMPVALPPANEQHRIVKKVDELMALCDRLKARLGEAGETRNQLAGAVVEQAVT